LKNQTYQQSDSFALSSIQQGSAADSRPSFITAMRLAISKDFIKILTDNHDSKSASGQDSISA